MDKLKLVILCATVAAFAVIYLPSESNAQSYFRMPSPWTYVCKNGTCVKKLRSDSTVIQSLDTCRLRCGRFRAIWSRPTGDVELSRVVVPFKPQNLRILPVTAPTDRIRELLNRVVQDFQGNILKMHPNYAEGGKNPFDKQYDNVIEGTVVQVQDQRVRPIAECAEVFKKTIELLKNRLADEKDGGVMIWDKDDNVGMDFVTACSNIRSFIFGIAQKSRFDTKSMAGNIIPAIASTNAIVGGFIVMTAFKVMKQDWYKCNSVYIQNRVNVRKELYHFDQIMAPNPKCYVCAEKPEIVLKIDLNKLTVGMLNEKVLKKELCMIAPDVEIEDGCGTILISSEEGETNEIFDKLLKDFKISSGTRLRCDDFLQNYNLVINIVIMSEEEAKARDKSVECFELVGDRSLLGPKEEEPTTSTNGKDLEKTQDKKDAEVVADDDDDLEIITPPDNEIKVLGTKRALDNKDEGTPAKKRRRAEEPTSTSGYTGYIIEVETIDLD